MGPYHCDFELKFWKFTIGHLGSFFFLGKLIWWLSTHSNTNYFSSRCLSVTISHEFWFLSHYSLYRIVCLSYYPEPFTWVQSGVFYILSVAQAFESTSMLSENKQNAFYTIYFFLENVMKHFWIKLMFSLLFSDLPIISKLYILFLFPLNTPGPIYDPYII